MSVASLNNTPVLEAVVMLPRAGVWCADVAVDSESAKGLGGGVTLVLGKLTLRGTAARAGATRGEVRLRVVGGAGGLGSVVEPKAFRSAPVDFVLRDLLGAAGERLSPTSAPAALSTQLGHWVRRQQRAGEALSLLADAARATWRVLPDGSVWLGTDTWPAASLPDGVLLREWPEQAKAEFGVESPSLLPGTTLGGRRVSSVEHAVRASELRTTCWFE